MAFDRTRPSSTPRRSAPLVLGGISSDGEVGFLSPVPVVLQAPQITAFLSGVESDTFANSVEAFPNIIFLTGVQSIGHLSDDVVGGDNPGSTSTITLAGVEADSGIGVFAGAAPAGVPRVKPVSNLDIPSILKLLQVPGGPCKGAFFNSGTKGTINWYNANVGLVSIVQFLSAADLDAYIRAYLDAYIRRITGEGGISDISFSSGASDLTSIGTLPQNSDDAYAATVIRLAYRYIQASQNFIWFDTNRGALSTILESMIVGNVRPDGLVNSFAPSRRIQGDVALLKNNCEDWAALNEFSSLLNSRNDTFNAARYSNLASSLASAIDATMWVTAGSFSPGFKSADTDLVLLPNFNPNIISQVYPQAMGVASLSGRFSQAYAFVNTNAPGWENCAYDPSPWLVLGLTASLRGDLTKANAQTSKFESLYASSPDTMSINELGMYQRIKSVLAGLPAA